MRPRGNKRNPGYKWISISDHASFEIKARAYFAEARQVMSEEEWRKRSGQHCLSRSNRPYKDTYLVVAWAFQELEKPLPYRAPAGKAVGDHVYEPVNKRVLPAEIDLQPAPGDPPWSEQPGTAAGEVPPEAEEEQRILWQDDRDFIPEDGFRGERYGYAFKLGLQGLGYYLEMERPCPGASCPARSQPELSADGASAADAPGCAPAVAAGAPSTPAAKEPSVAAPPPPPRDWLGPYAVSTDDEALGPAVFDDVPSIYDTLVRTTAPGRYARTYKDGVMALLTKSLVHKHSPYCGRFALGRRRGRAHVASTHPSRAARSSGHASRLVFERRRSPLADAGLVA